MAGHPSNPRAVVITPGSAPGTMAIFVSESPGADVNPRETVDALTGALGGAGAGVVHAFPATASCHANPGDALWGDEPACDKLWDGARRRRGADDDGRRVFARERWRCGRIRC